MAQYGTQAPFLHEQYATADRLQARIDVHEGYSERKLDFYGIVLDELQLVPGLWLLDVGCGSGGYHPRLAGSGISAVALDFSAGMARTSQHQAVERGLPVQILQADSQRLPFADASFERVMANHMLYHVPDILAALREMRRVLKPGGRVVLTTNAVDHTERITALHREAARELGYTEGPISGLNFTLDHLNLVREVFPNAEVVMIPNAFIFPSAEPALQHYMSGRVDALADRPADDSHRPRLRAVVEAKIQAIVAREGEFRVPKDAGCFVATV